MEDLLHKDEQRNSGIYNWTRSCVIASACIALGKKMLCVLEHCRVAPPAGTVAEQSLPLTFFDLPWIRFPRVQRLLFFKFSHSRTHFVETFVPNLKNSLSLALKHFFPLAGNLIIHPDSIRPEIRYKDGDSVSLTIAESSSDFDDLTGNHPRNTEEFYPFVPQIAPSTHLADTVVAPVLALQLTLFPNLGICLGITFHHVALDANSLIRFLKSWASISKLGGDDDGVFTGGSCLPLYVRTVREDPNGLETRLWRQFKEIKLDEGEIPFPVKNRVRATFVMSQTNMQRLKKLVSTRQPTSLHVSTFTVTCAYVWNCIVKSREVLNGKEVADEDELEQFVCVADCRARFEPPIPKTYFGNCLTTCFVMAKHRQLVGEEGFLTAAQLIGEAISRRAQNEEEHLKNLAAVALRLAEPKWQRIIGVAGSPKLGFYGTDFGLGEPIKSEIVSIDITGAISLSECRDSEGDIQVGLSFPKIQMDAFATIYADGLHIL